jgi:hypothetical protein
MLWIESKVSMSPGSIAREDVVGFIPGLRLSPNGEQQLKSEDG